MPRPKLGNYGPHGSARINENVTFHEAAVSQDQTHNLLVRSQALNHRATRPSQMQLNLSSRLFLHSTLTHKHSSLFQRHHFWI